MGRSYWFECSRCGFRAKVSGRADRGLNFFVQTIVCRDCKQLYDAVTRVRVAAPSETEKNPTGPRRSKLLPELGTNGTAPPFQLVLNRLLYTGSRTFQWRQFALQCPVSNRHRVELWNDPDKCPRCGIYLEKNVLPYRIWD
jgi:hypothetical protein